MSDRVAPSARAQPRPARLHAGGADVRLRAGVRRAEPASARWDLAVANSPMQVPWPREQGLLRHTPR